MTGPHSDSQNATTRPISVAELLAKNDMIGSPPISGRRRRRRGNAEAVTVAELTGEIPVVGDDDQHAKTTHSTAHSRRANGGVRDAEQMSEEPPGFEGPPGPAAVGAEGMSPDPLVDYADIPVDVMDTEVREAQPVTEDSAYVRSYLNGPASRLVSGTTMARGPEGAESAVGEDLGNVDSGADSAVPGDDGYAGPSRAQTLLHGGLVVLQSIFAVMLGAGLFVAFDQLWRWNNIVALVLSVVVILGLVVGVRVVRKTEDIVSTLIAVAVGALVTLGPLALLQSA
ncbi:hypothetical protein MSM1_09895 [Mycobacterium sp. SM1]|uniref:hypothetical protein n=1 Tax=Mycobacterium sp. SM1 TaxID=2816243 RepID=UPI001BCFE457|nr:hypothetical protein [Mycobacterium sp. SM1]MBS4728631.1 hypothetical protein [Mycobacterium sp. SM1]